MGKLKPLKCKSMEWYLHGVDVELLWEIEHACIPRRCTKSQKQAKGKKTCIEDAGCCVGNDGHDGRYQIRSAPGRETLKQGDTISQEEYMNLAQLSNISIGEIGPLVG